MLTSDTALHNFIVDDAQHSLRFVRDLDAPPARVFEAWTTPEQLALWWDATGEKLAICDMDLRPGGAFKFVTRHHPDKPFTGVYREITPPSLLVFDANGAVGRVELDQRGTGTRMTVEIACRSADHLAQFVAVGVAAGTSRTLDNLVAYLAIA